MPGPATAGRLMTRRQVLIAVGAVAVGGAAVTTLELLRGWPAAFQAAATPTPNLTYRSRPDLIPPSIQTTTPAAPSHRASSSSLRPMAGI